MQFADGVTRKRGGKAVIELGGVHGVYVGSGRRYDSIQCYVDGIQCEAREAHFGGIVIQPIASSDSRRLPVVSAKRKKGSLLASLSQLIKMLQHAIANGEMTSVVVRRAINQLATLGFAYDDETFPPLANTQDFKDASKDSPGDLAEALLWKLGKWKAYKKFAEQYASPTSEVTKTGVVFYAFAQHLKDPSKPIFDQHALRALWAIYGSMNAEEQRRCRSYLFNSEATEWKSTGSGSEALDCYRVYLHRVKKLTKVADAPTKQALDRLLMPLGQAIKESTTSYQQFSRLCGWAQK